MGRSAVLAVVNSLNLCFQLTKPKHRGIIDGIKEDELFYLDMTSKALASVLSIACTVRLMINCQDGKVSEFRSYSFDVV